MREGARCIGAESVVNVPCSADFCFLVGGEREANLFENFFTLLIRLAVIVFESCGDSFSDVPSGFGEIETEEIGVVGTNCLDTTRCNTFERILCLGDSLISSFHLRLESSNDAC